MKSPGSLISPSIPKGLGGSNLPLSATESLSLGTLEFGWTVPILIDQSGRIIAGAL
jgi:hypothetical protein